MADVAGERGRGLIQLWGPFLNLEFRRKSVIIRPAVDPQRRAQTTNAVAITVIFMDMHKRLCIIL